MPEHVSAMKGREQPLPAFRRVQRPDIQGMRAVAVLSVLLGHASLAGFSGGYVGVDVFFVISGFLITGILAREATSTGTVSIVNFYARRARRILPAAGVVLLAITVCAAIAYTAGDLATVLGDVGWAAFFAENLHLAQAGTGYFSTDTFVSPVQHYWSLAVEEQFYLVWPALIWLVMRVTRRRTPAAARGHRAGPGLGYATAAIAVLGVASFAWSVHDTVASPHSAYFSTFTRGWELCVGAVLALLVGSVGRLPLAVKAVLSWGGLAAIAFAVGCYDPATPFPGYAAALPVIGSAMVLAGGIDGPAYGAQSLLSVRPLTYLGDISYSLYLWHWPILIIAPVAVGHPLSTRARLVLVVLAIAVSALSYRFLEEPVRRAKALDVHRLRPLALWPAALVVVLGGALVANQTVVSAHADAAERARHAVERAEADATPASLRAQVVAAAGRAHSAAPLPDALVPDLTTLFSDVSRTVPACDDLQKAPTLGYCPTGDVTSSRAIVLWGDSHAAMWTKPLSQLAKARHQKLITFSYRGGSCQPVRALEWMKGRAYTDCLAYHDWVIEQIKRIKPDQVILAGFIRSYYSKPDKSGPLSWKDSNTAFRAGAARTLDLLAPLTDRVDVLSDITVLPKDAGRCLGSRAATNATCAEPRNRDLADRSAAWGALARSRGDHFVDLAPWFCAEHICPVVVGTTVVYRDSDHVTTTYAERLKPVLKQQLGL